MQKDKRTQALGFLQTDTLFYVDMLECISRGRAEIVYAECENPSLNGVLLYDKPSGIYMLAATKTLGACTALSCLQTKEVAQKSGWLVTHGDGAREAVYSKLHVVWETPVWQVAYLDTPPFAIKDGLRFGLAKREEIELIKKTYDKESPENIERLAKSGKIHCAFCGDEFVGYIGEHPEGSMGMLHVFPEYRRKGYAEALESLLANKYIEQGRIPYGHVVVGNDASMALQKKLGFQVADEKIYWLKEG